MRSLPRQSFLLFLALFLALCGGRAAIKPGYKVVVEVSVDEQGKLEAVNVVESDDRSATQLLDRIAMNLAGQVPQKPRTGPDGKPVKFKVRVPFDFPVEDDEGPTANDVPKPAIRSAQQIFYPEKLAATGTVGGAILELKIGADGHMESVTVLRASHPEFATAARSAVEKWEFAPAQREGIPVSSRWRIAVNFSIDGKEPDWKWRVAPRPSLGSHTVVRVKAPPVPPAAQAAPAPAAPALVVPGLPAEKK